MTMFDFLYAALLLAVAVGAYFASYTKGFKDGVKHVDDASSGWEDEAQWWRRNATAVREPHAREHAA